MSSFSASSESVAQLARRMAALGVKESDLEETFIRSGGHGGQHVNKVATCVLLVHRPTGTQVKCQTSRQQGVNRFLARQLLANRIEAARQARANAVRTRREKLRRQQRRRPKNVKERMLADKAHQAVKKSLRRKVGLD